MKSGSGRGGDDGPGGAFGVWGGAHVGESPEEDRPTAELAPEIGFAVPMT